MSASANPDIVEDGLVFLYDTDDGKSYKGEPTTNLISGVANPNLSISGWYSTGWNGSISVDTDEGALVLNATNGWRSMSYDFGVTNGTVTVQFDYKLKSAEHTNIYMVVLNGTHLGSYTQYLDGSLYPSLTEYKTYKKTFTTTTDSKICIVLRGTDNAGLTDEMFVKNLQVEQKSHATPFVNGTRSATQGLLDRTGNSTIDISNVSFDSNAQMTAFDGTDDYISLSQNVTVPAVGFTVMMAINVNDSQSSSGWNYWFRQTANDGHKYEFGCYGTNGNQFQFKDNIIGSSSVVATLNSSEFTILHFGSTSSSYSFYSKNGESKVLSNSSGGWTGGDDINFSEFFRAGSSYFGAKAINMLIYNKELSQKEILQNYNATKSRFGL